MLYASAGMVHNELDQTKITLKLRGKIYECHDKYWTVILAYLFYLNSLHPNTHEDIIKIHARLYPEAPGTRIFCSAVVNTRKILPLFTENDDQFWKIKTKRNCFMT